MIPSTPRPRQREDLPSWQQQLAACITSVPELLAALGLDARTVPQASVRSHSFPLRVPLSYVARMRHGDATDPLLRQALPSLAETLEQPGFVSDPLSEREALAAPGLLRKYHGRALLITTAVCAIHCRYCFRREFPYAEQSETPRWSEALAEIERDTNIREVILSGGDPLALGNARLAALTRALERAPHIERLRVHTRLPVVLPARVDAGLSEWLESLRWPVVIVLHANHANEIDGEVAGACARLRASGATLLNQSVLLRGVNDDAPTLAALSERLIAAGVLPYYLHLLDRVRGTTHFEVDELRARRIVGELSGHMPGYLVPRLVREIPGESSKTPVPPLFPHPSRAGM
jgi:EF-P beta-lysylation protein EpmB